MPGCACLPRRSSWAAIELVAANARDLEEAKAAGLNTAALERLTLSAGRIEDMVQSLLDVAALPDPLGETVTASRRPNGLDVRQVRVPLGVIFMIYESRPNVTVDAAALCVKSGNAVILRGGKEALATNSALHRILADQLVACGLPQSSVQLVDDRGPRGCRRVPHVLGPDRPGDPARRRKPDPPRGRRGDDAGAQALPGKLPRLRRRSLRHRHGGQDHCECKGAAPGCVQRRRNAPGASNGCAPSFFRWPPSHSFMRTSSCAAMRRPGNWSRP